MPPLVNTRYQYARAFQDDSNRWYSEIPRPFRFSNQTDNVPYIVKTGDTLQVLAYRHYRGLEGAPQFWRAIAEFNDIIDATLPLEEGKLLIIPSLRWVQETFLAPPDEYRTFITQIGVTS